jgi:uncharacterized protein YceH (UPF0502 family)
MAELLLRGAQTVGELRGRAARMEPIADLAALKPVLDGLVQKGLVISLSPEGRGQVVAHGLYQPNELDRVRAEMGSGGGAAGGEDAPPVKVRTAEPSEVASLRTELTRLREELDALRSEVDRLRGLVT